MDKKLLKIRAKEYLATMGATLSVSKEHLPRDYRAMALGFSKGAVSGVIVPKDWRKLSNPLEINSLPEHLPAGLIVSFEHLQLNEFMIIQRYINVIQFESLERVSENDWSVLDTEMRNI